MPGHRSRKQARLVSAACTLACASLSTAAFAQVPPPRPWWSPVPYAPPQPYGQRAPYTPGAPYAQTIPYAQPGQYTPPGPYAQPNPYARPGPYAQPLPYNNGPQAAPGYVQLGGSSDDFTSDRAHGWVIMRASGGVGASLGPRGAVLPSFILDTTAGYRWAFSRRASIAFEAGYSYDSEPHRGGMFGTIGLGPELYVSRMLQIGWDPKLVLGSAWPGFAIGVRNTLIVPLFMHMLNVEIGHQYLRAGSLDRHELRAQLGFDVGGLIQYVMTSALAR